MEDAAKVHVHHHKDPAGFGHADIGWIGGLFLVTNNIIGPAMLQLPGVFQVSGWLPSLTVLILCAVWTVLSAQFLARSMALFPGNGAFTKRMEFGKIAYHLLPRWLYYIASATLVFVFFTQNLANILVTSQTMDNMIMASTGKTCAVVLDASAKNHWECISGDMADTSSDSLFGKATVFTLGYAVTLVVAIPLGIMNLDDNIIIQIGGMILTFVCVIVWVANFVAMGLKPALLPTLAPHGDTGYLQLLPAILFNFGFVTTIPSWINEKRKDVGVTPTLWGAQALASVQYVLTAIFAGLAMDFSDGVDITARLNDPKQHGVWLASRIMTFIFPLANILTSIPVFSIIIRYNLLQLEGVKMPVWLANLVAVFLPWVVAVPFYSGNQVNTLITWSSALLFVLINLLLPTAMFLAAERKKADGSLALPPDPLDYDEDIVLGGGGGTRDAATGLAADDDEEEGGGAGDSALLLGGGKAGAGSRAAPLLGGAGGKKPAAGASAAAGADPFGTESLAGSADAKLSLLSLLTNPSRLRVKFVGGGDVTGGPRGASFTGTGPDGEELIVETGEGAGPPEEDIHALPEWARSRLCSEVTFGRALLGLACAAGVTAIALQIWSQITNPPPV